MDGATGASSKSECKNKDSVEATAKSLAKSGEIKDSLPVVACSSSSAGSSSAGSVTEEEEMLEPHCWVCLNPFCDIKCQKCPRTFHSKCLMDATSLQYTETGNSVVLNHSRLVHLIPTFRIFKMITCSECVLSAHSDEILSQKSQEERKDFLLQLFDKILGKYHYYDDLRELESTEYKIDLNAIKKKISDDEYRNLTAILADSKFVLHNVAVYHDGYRGVPYSQILNGAKNLKAECESTVNDYMNCPQCFIRMNISKNREIVVCDKPHLLAWVKVGSLRWPAIVIGVDIKREQYAVDVIYFAKNKFEKKCQAKLNDCFLYNIRNSVSKIPQHVQAVQACDMYKATLNAKFGAVVLPAKNEEISLGPNLQEAVARMFPEFVGREATSQVSSTV